MKKIRLIISKYAHNKGEGLPIDFFFSYTVRDLNHALLKILANLHGQTKLPLVQQSNLFCCCA